MNQDNVAKTDNIAAELLPSQVTTMQDSLSTSVSIDIPNIDAVPEAQLSTAIVGGDAQPWPTEEIIMGDLVASNNALMASVALEPAPLVNEAFPVASEPLDVAVPTPAAATDTTNEAFPVAGSIVEAVAEADVQPRNGARGTKEQKHHKSPKQAPVKQLPAARPIVEIRSPLGFLRDGEDHINLGAAAQSSLSWRMSQNYAQLFVTAEDGPFLTILGYWHYLLSPDKDPQFRDRKAIDVRKLVDKKKMLVAVEHFRDKIARAYWEKLTQNTELAEELKATELPFDAYYIFGKRDPKLVNSQVAIPEKFARWVIPLFYEMRAALREGRQPDFSVTTDEVLMQRDNENRRAQGQRRGGNDRQARDTWSAAGIDKVREGLRSGGKGQGQQRDAAVLGGKPREQRDGGQRRR